MQKASRKKIVVVYHASCPDGFGAAWAAWKKFGVRAEYYPRAHTEQPLKLNGKDIYFLDFSYKPEVMRQLAKNNHVAIVDHHVTAKDSVALAHESLYDMKHSGAVLAWKYFHPKKPLPRLLRHIEDEDLWKFKLAGTAAVNARMELLDFDFKKWDKVIRDFERPALRRRFIKEGELLAGYRTRMARRLVEESSVPVKFVGYNILAINAARPFTSEIGNMLCRIKPPIAIVWQERNNVIAVSLRSNGTVDVAKIAKRFGGGGHKASAAFGLPVGAKKPWTYIKK